MNAIAGGSKMHSYVQDGVRKRTSGSFFRGEQTNFFPSDASYLTSSVVSQYLVNGLVPAQPFIDKDTRIVAFGSCFAANIANYLNKIGYDVATKRDQTAYVSTMGDGIVNTFALRQQFEWAWLDKKPQSALWHGYDAAEFGYDEAVRLRTAELFDSADVFVLTLGLSEIWYDEPTGEVFWRAVPADRYDPARHKFRVSTHHENLVNLLEIYKLIRQRRPEAAIVFTLSPIPLTATFRPIGCLAANSASKAILRAALDEFLRAAQARDEKLFYFPSYEIVQGPFNNPFLPDRRHVRKHVLDFNMRVFERYYCLSGVTDAQIERAFRTAFVKDQLVDAATRARRPDKLAGTPEEKRKFKTEARKLARVSDRLRERAAKIAAQADARAKARRAKRAEA
ncbi:GSCFA domain-containing protein [Methylocella sp.]|uniref:GSCFA domain-containing protein n=1 Tax=Methylocella sp. TaxID=1978226 RepID=UPI0035AEF478